MHALYKGVSTQIKENETREETFKFNNEIRTNIENRSKYSLYEKHKCWQM